MTYSDEVYELACTVIKETDNAILIDTHTGENLWIPLSQVKEIHRDGKGVGRIIITQWIAKKKNLI